MTNTPIPEDVMKAARDASLSCITGMCSTYRHDYALLPEAERKSLYVVMSQLAYHDVAPVIASALMAERERCAEVAKNCRLTVPLIPGAADGASMASKQISSAIMAERGGE